MMRAPLQPSGWPRAMAPPLTFSLFEIDAELADAGEHLGGESFVQFDQIDLLDASGRRA